MPQVPLSQNVGVETRPLPGPRVDVNAPIEAFGGGAAIKHPDISGLADEAKNIFLEERQKADDVAQVASGSQLAALHTKLLLNAKSQLGANAFTTPETTNEDWQKGTAEIADSLTSPAQREQFAKMAAMHQSELDGAVQAHVAAQRQVYTGQQLDSYIKNAKDVGLATGTPEAISLSIDNQTIALHKLLTNAGADPETVKQTIAANASDMHVAFIGQLVDAGQDITAKQYFDAHKSEILGSELGKVERLVGDGSTEGESRRQADKILQTATTFDDAMKQVGQIENTKVADATEHRIRQHFADVANQREAQQKANYEAAGKILEQTHSTSAIPRTMWLDGLSQAQRDTLRSQENLFHAPPKEGPGDPNKFLELQHESIFNPATFSQRNILSIPGLNFTQQRELQDKQSTANRPDLAGLQHDVTKFESDVQRYQNEIDREGLNGNTEAVTLYTQRKNEAQTSLDKARRDLETKRAGGIAPPIEPTEAEKAQAARLQKAGIAPLPSTPTYSTGPAPVQKRPPTPAMLRDILLGGPVYIDYLQKIGIDAPSSVQAARALLDSMIPPPPEPKKQ